MGVSVWEWDRHPCGSAMSLFHMSSLQCFTYLVSRHVCFFGCLWATKNTAVLCRSWTWPGPSLTLLNPGIKQARLATEKTIWLKRCNFIKGTVESLLLQENPRCFGSPTLSSLSCSIPSRTRACGLSCNAAAQAGLKRKQATVSHLL